MTQAKTAKQEALDLIGKMPDEVSTQTILAELQFKMVVEERLEQVARGDVISHEEAKRRLSKWLDSSG